MQLLVEEERLLVTFGGKSVDLCVLPFLLSQKLGFTLLEDALNDELVLEFLVGAANVDGGVFEDEFGVAFYGSWADEVELALGQFAESFLGAGAEDELADCEWKSRLAKIKKRVKISESGKVAGEAAFAEGAGASLFYVMMLLVRGTSARVLQRTNGEKRERRRCDAKIRALFSDKTYHFVA